MLDREIERGSVSGGLINAWAIQGLFEVLTDAQWPVDDLRMKTIRFGDLVRGLGRPDVVTLWTKPGANRVLTEAVKKNRVLTVMQEPGKRDRGMIGFELKPGALFMVFPRALPREKNARLVGINYQLVAEPVTLKVFRAKTGKTSRLK